MRKTNIKRQISNLIVGNTVYIDEYQDKYYFVKALKNLFPSFSEDEIYDSIQSTNNALKGSRKKGKYVNMLLDTLERIRQSKGKEWEKN
jgi:hypothetical protein